jgi:hypothetical protein
MTWKAYLFHILVPVPYLSHYDIIDKTTLFLSALWLQSVLQ